MGTTFQSIGGINQVTILIYIQASRLFRGAISFIPYNRRKLGISLAESQKGVKGELQKGVKGELRNRFNLISEERVKKIEQNSESLMKIG